jgi:ribosome-binding factor A
MSKVTSKAQSQRQLRVGEQIRRSLSDILNRGEIHDPDLNRIPITVGEVAVSADLMIATAFVLPLGGEDRDVALSLLRKHRYEIRHLITRALTLKFSPEIRFQIDETFDRIEATNRMFSDERVKRDIEAKDPATDSAKDPE